ncbi:MAG: RnfABCDGE type electron transport complex subunit D [Ruminococcus sp.]|jgi:electron transport complex protein RnfD|nr:RnfABCDGE type electron transport complex subunit D [Ruminococcus sp.]
MNDMLTVSPSPHLRGKGSTRNVMLGVILALAPAAVAGCIIFGWRAALVLAVTMLSAVVFEALYNLITKTKQTTGDLSALLTGLLLGMNLSSAVPLYIPVIGAFAAIVIVKQLFGGLGQNFANPAISARIILSVCFAAEMGSYAEPALNFLKFDAVTAPTPLSANYLVAGADKVLPFTLTDMLFGTTGGCIGETCALALIIGAIGLMAFRIITPTIPLSFIGTVFVLTLIYTGSIDETIYYTLAGGLMLGAFFMATDYTTSPLTERGKLIFGIGCGLITFVIRFFTKMPEGVSFSILLMNLLTPLIDDIVLTHPLGAKKSVKPEVTK